MSKNGNDLTCTWNVNSMTQTMVPDILRNLHKRISFRNDFVVRVARKAAPFKALLAGKLVPQPPL